MKPLLRWNLIFTLSLVGFFIARSLGFSDYCIKEDASYICITVFWLYILQSFLIGNITYLYSKSKVVTKYIKKCLELSWFSSELCLSLGMLGTLAGFVMMLGGFKTLNIEDPATSQALLTQLGRSMATALLTTVVGLVCGNLLKMQCLNLDVEINNEK